VFSYLHSFPTRRSSDLSFLICNGSSHLLDKGGMVLGVLEDYSYEQGVLLVAPDSLLIGYSDGLVEPENVYGEEFGFDQTIAVTEDRKSTRLNSSHDQIS